MNKITITMAAALLSLAAYAQDTTATPAAKADSAACNGGSCPAKACKAMPHAAWLNIETITAEAANGDPIAQYTIAYLTDEGINTPKDSAKAHEMYKTALPTLEKAAADGHAGACRALAHMYNMGKGVEKDAAKAKQYWEMCKKCGDKGNCALPSDTAAPATDSANTNPEQKM